MKFSRVSFFWIGGLAALMTFQSCSPNPVTGKKEMIFMSPERELAIGKEAHPSIVASMGLYEDRRMQEFVSQKGKQMADISHRPEIPFQFFIVDSPVVNAFAVPGGYVYFTRGIMAHFNNEAEFAGVLGHEIGHITARHSARQQTSQIFGQAGLIAGMILSEQVRQMGEAAEQAMGMLLMSYSRAHETESDKLGVEYSSKIGYDAVEMADFFSTLKRLSDQSGRAIPTFMSTHPDPGDRYNNVKKMAQELQVRSPGNYAINRDSYLRMIDGLVYGDDPKQGFVENSVFYHPELKFQFPVPAGWGYENSPSQFQMAPKDGKAVLVLTLAQGNSLEEAAQNVAKQFNGRVLQSSRSTINGNQALVMVTQPQPQQQQGQPQQQQDPNTVVQIGSWLIQYGGLIYAFHGMSYAPTFNTFLPTFRSSAEGFRLLNDRDKLNRQPERVLIRTVPRDGTFQDTMRGFGIPAARINELSILNGMMPNDPVKRGSLVKIVGRQ